MFALGEVYYSTFVSLFPEMMIQEDPRYDVDVDGSCTDVFLCKE